MRVTVLGGSAAGPGAGAGCSGYLIQDGDSAIVIDLGPGTLIELKKHVDPRRLDGIVLSHVHLDHTLDIGALRYSLKYSPSPAQAPVPLWVPPDSSQLFEHFARAYSAPSEDPLQFYDDVFDIRSFSPDAPLEVGAFKLAFAPCVHYVPTWAIRIDPPGSGSSVGYSADTGPAAGLASTLSGVALFLCEATLLDPGPEPFETRGHLTAAEAGALATTIGCETLLLTHMWEEIDRNRLRSDAEAQFSGRIEIARPGLAVNLS
jgi:ribonuclease BN (tRNA processing enzyme)